MKERDYEKIGLAIHKHFFGGKNIKQAIKEAAYEMDGENNGLWSRDWDYFERLAQKSFETLNGIKGKPKFEYRYHLLWGNYFGYGNGEETLDINFEDVTKNHLNHENNPGT